jgi:hypothetical protein
VTCSQHRDMYPFLDSSVSVSTLPLRQTHLGSFWATAHSFEFAEVERAGVSILGRHNRCCIQFSNYLRAEAAQTNSSHEGLEFLRIRLQKKVIDFCLNTSVPENDLTYPRPEKTNQYAQ